MPEKLGSVNPENLPGKLTALNLTAQICSAVGRFTSRAGAEARTIEIVGVDAASSIAKSIREVGAVIVGSSESDRENASAWLTSSGYRWE